MKFIGRHAELDALRDWWERGSDRPALVWARRRVGKTALIERFASELPRVVFHIGVGGPVAGELARMSDAVMTAGIGGVRDMTANPYRDWRDALDHLAGVAADEPRCTPSGRERRVMGRSRTPWASTRRVHWIVSSRPGSLNG